MSAFAPKRTLSAMPVVQPVLDMMAEGLTSNHSVDKLHAGQVCLVKVHAINNGICHIRTAEVGPHRIRLQKQIYPSDQGRCKSMYDHT